MTFIKGKLYFVNGNIVCLPYDDQADYSAFLKTSAANGHRQVIVTSEIMLDYIAYIYSEKNRKVYEIDFMDEDREGAEEINEMLLKINGDPSYVRLLIEKLIPHVAKSSIGIKKVHIKDNLEGFADYYVQANGIVCADEAHFLSVTKELCDFVKKCL